MPLALFRINSWIGVQKIHYGEQADEKELNDILTLLQVA